MATPYRTTEGIENQFYNHLGHFALVKFLSPLIKATAEVRHVILGVLGVYFPKLTLGK